MKLIESGGGKIPDNLGMLKNIFFFLALNKRGYPHDIFSYFSSET